ncbi:MAG: methyltransferase domain-containing protein [Chloroflexota bacterium]
MSAIEQGQVIQSAAEVYEQFFLPALFQQWAAPVVAAAKIGPGQRVLDVACGTGVVTRLVAEQVGVAGDVVGLDVNAGMLAVARAKAPHIDWREGQAERLPFADNSFDAVVSQFGLMFFNDRTRAIQEMMRVLQPGGMLAVVVWDSLDNTPGYMAVVHLLRRLFGEEAAGGLRMPYVLGETAVLRQIFRDAGYPSAAIATYSGKARFPSIESWMYTDIRGWTLADRIDDEQYAELLAEAEVELRPFLNSDGTVSFTAPAHIVTLTK